VSKDQGHRRARRHLTDQRQAEMGQPIPPARSAAGQAPLRGLAVEVGPNGTRKGIRATLAQAYRSRIVLPSPDQE